jgi:hypothetical protein
LSAKDRAALGKVAQRPFFAQRRILALFRHLKGRAKTRIPAADRFLPLWENCKSPRKIEALKCPLPMHNIEPHFRWRDLYTAEGDPLSPFFGRTYSEFEFSHRLYNYYLHPQWDAFGSATLYGKILFVDYDDGFAIIELIGEWNDTLHDDIMYLKRNIADPLLRQNITKFALFCENVLNFHASPDDDYYAEWAEEVHEEGGWIAVLNTRQHVEEEMHEARLQHYVHFGSDYNDLNWRTQKPLVVFQLLDALVQGRMRRVGY